MTRSSLAPTASYSRMATVVPGPEISLISEECGSVQHAASETSTQGQGELDLIYVTQSSETAPCELDSGEAATSLEWFRSTFSQVEKNGIITLKEFKHRAKKDVSLKLLLIPWYLS